MYTVLIRGLEFYAHHGVPREEQVIGHRYKVDLEMEVEGATDETDDICDTVDYGAASQLVIAVAQSRQVKTVERLAKIVAGQLLKEHVCIQKLTITLVKVHPSAPVIAAEAGVRLTVSR